MSLGLEELQRDIVSLDRYFDGGLRQKAAYDFATSVREAWMWSNRPSRPF